MLADAGFTEATMHGWTGYRTSKYTQGALVTARKAAGGVGQALGEAYRVLKPGGRLLFFEHGLSPQPSIQWWQRRLNWLEMRLADGCRLDRDIRGLVAAQPFSSVGIDQFYMSSFPKTHGYMSRGVATK